MTLACASLAVMWAPRRARPPGARADRPVAAGPGAAGAAGRAVPAPLPRAVGGVDLPRAVAARASWASRLVALSGMLLSASLNALYGTSDSSASSAGAYPFYGLVTGSNYRQIREDLGAELERLPDERARTRLIYRRGWERLRADPGTALLTLGRNLRKFAGKTPAVLYGVVSPQAAVPLALGARAAHAAGAVARPLARDARCSASRCWRSSGTCWRCAPERASLLAGRDRRHRAVGAGRVRRRRAARPGRVVPAAGRPARGRARTRAAPARGCARGRITHDARPGLVGRGPGRHRPGRTGARARGGAPARRGCARITARRRVRGARCGRRRRSSSPTASGRTSTRP